MSDLRQQVASELKCWVATRQALRVAESLLREDPDDPIRQERLKQATLTAKDATAELRAALRTKGYTPQDLQRVLANS